MRVRCLFGLAVVAGAAVSANGFEYRCRWVERVGNTDVVIGGNNVDFDGGTGAPRRLRLQFGVFDDGGSVAPGGGFVGWNVGTLDVSGSDGNSAERRTPGRIAPFNFATGPNSNGNPPVPAGGDVDFQHLSEIDSTLGTQAPFWGCTPAPGEVPAPQPAALVRGRNSFVSVYEITIDPTDGFQPYSITAGGNLIAATEWRVVGNPLFPDCGDPDDPGDNVPGTIVYAPFPTDPVAFTCSINIVPAPGAAALLGLGGLLAARRRR
jgi:hypothetical protein